MRNKWLLGLFAVLLGLVSLLQGIYPAANQYLLQIITSLIILISLATLAIKKESVQYSSPMDFVLPLFILIYLIGTFFAVSAKLAAAETLNYINYFLIFVFIKALSKEEGNMEKLLQIIFGLIVFTCAVGLGSAIGILPIGGAYSQIGYWIKGPLSNHDVYGFLCFFGVLLGFGLYQITQANWKRLIYALSGFLLVLGGMNASAISAMLLFPIGLFALIILSWRNWTKIIAYTLLLLLPYLFIAQKFGKAMTERNFWEMLWGLVFGLLITVVFVFLSELIRKLQDDVRRCFGYISIVAGVLAILAISFFPAKLIPKNVMQNFSVDAIGGTVSERALFYGDSYDFIQTNPLIGAGGGAWSVVYETYQSKTTVSQQVQSWFMQMWMESGLIGLLLFIAFIIIFLIGSYKAIKKYNLLGITIACCGMYLLLHSFFDNSLQDFFIAILFWSLCAMLSQMNEEEKGQYRVSQYPFIILAIISLAVSSMSFVGVQYKIAGGEAIGWEDYKGASKAFEKAIKWNPLDDESKLSYIYAKLFRIGKGEEQEPGFVDEFNHTLKTVLENGNQNAQIVAAGQELYDYTSQTEESLTAAERLVALRPLSPNSYETLARAYASHSNEQLKQGDKEGAKETLNKIINLPGRMEQLTAHKEAVSPSAETLIIIQRATVALKELE